ncbi:unnamed protein product [Boreogadus saida]
MIQPLSAHRILKAPLHKQHSNASLGVVNTADGAAVIPPLVSTCLGGGLWAVPISDPSPVVVAVGIVWRGLAEASATAATQSPLLNVELPGEGSEALWLTPWSIVVLGRDNPRGLDPQQSGSGVGMTSDWASEGPVTLALFWCEMDQ